MKKISRALALNNLGRLALGACAVALVAAPVTTSARSAVASSQAADVNAFYRLRGGAPLWLAPRSGAAAQELVQLLATAQADNLNPRRYNVRALQKALDAARSGDPGAVQRAEMALSLAFAAYVHDVKRDPGVGIVYVDRELKPSAASAQAVLAEAASAPSLSEYVSNLGWMHPIYSQLRQAIASRMYRSEAERRLLAINLERARALPSGEQRYVLINAPAARLYMFGRVFVGYAFAEGWAHYTEEMMRVEGVGGGTDETLIGQLSNALLRDCRFLSAIGMHTGSMTQQQSYDLFQKQCYQDSGNAKQQAARGTYDPAYLNYTMGKLMIRKLRDDWSASRGGEKAWKAFHDQFLSYGGPPIPLVRKQMMGGDAKAVF